jgi:acetyl esterase/lipase
MASREFHELMRAIDTTMPDPRDPPLRVREKMHAIHPLDYPPEARVERFSLAGVPCAELRMPGSDPSRLMVMVHGGAFVSTGIVHYLPYLALLSHHLDAAALVFEYSLAPENRYPRQIEEAVAVYRELLAGGRDARRIALVGDSCGGGMALAALMRLRALGVPLPACCVALTPWFDLEQQGDAALNPRGVDPFVNAPWIRQRGRDYVGPGGNLRDPLVSPIHADLRGLPPLYLVSGQVDTTCDDSTRLAAHAARDGVAVMLEVVPEMIHGFPGLAGVLPEARVVLGNAGAFVRRHIP